MPQTGLTQCQLWGESGLRHPELSGAETRYGADVILGRSAGDKPMPETLREAAPALPYRVHTNYELGLMLSGVKPLAAFSFSDWTIDTLPTHIRRYLRMFDRHVALGAFVKREWTRPPEGQNDPGSWMVLYAFPEEEWRIDRMIELKEAIFERRWTREDERLEGRLLGYEEWQNDLWLSTDPFDLPLE